MTDQVTTRPKCAACGEEIVAGYRYCGKCGARLDQDTTPVTDQIRAVIKSELKDQKVLEIETAQAVVSRVSDWAKLFAFFTAIPVAFLLFGLAIWGVTKFADVNEKLKGADARVESLQSQSTQLEGRYRSLQQDAERYESLDRELQSVKSDVSELKKHVAFEPSSALTADLQQKLLTSLRGFEKYLQTLGYAGSKGQLKVKVGALPSDVHSDHGDQGTTSQTDAVYDQGKRRLTMTEEFATGSPANILTFYAEHVLARTSGNQSVTCAAMGFAVSDYFATSFLDTPPRDRQGTGPARTLLATFHLLQCAKFSGRCASNWANNF